VAEEKNTFHPPAGGAASAGSSTIDTTNQTVPELEIKAQ
jgi:hypothetical protein